MMNELSLLLTSTLWSTKLECIAGFCLREALSYIELMSLVTMKP